MEATQMLLGEYEKVIDRLYKSDEWLSSSSYDTWETVKDAKLRNKRVELEKEAYKLQKDLHKHLNINR